MPKILSCQNLWHPVVRGAAIATPSAGGGEGCHRAQNVCAVLRYITRHAVSSRPNSRYASGGILIKQDSGEQSQSIVGVYARRRDGEILVHDSAWRPKPGFDSAYSLRECALVHFVEGRMIDHVQRVTDKSVISIAEKTYLAYRSLLKEQAEHELLLDQETRHARAREYAEGREQRALEREKELLSLARKHLQSVGIADTRFRRRSPHLPHRKTGCWGLGCRRTLDSEQELEHVVCGWLVCECGRCGCGRPNDLPVAVR